MTIILLLEQLRLISVLFRQSGKWLRAGKHMHLWYVQISFKFIQSHRHPSCSHPHMCVFSYAVWFLSTSSNRYLFGKSSVTKCFVSTLLIIKKAGKDLTSFCRIKNVSAIICWRKGTRNWNQITSEVGLETDPFLISSLNLVN